VSYPDIYLYLIESPGKPLNDFILFLKVKIEFMMMMAGSLG